MANVFGPKNLPPTQKGKGKDVHAGDTAVSTVKGKGAAPAPKYYHPSSKKK